MADPRRLTPKEDLGCALLGQIAHEINQGGLRADKAIGEILTSDCVRWVEGIAREIPIEKLDRLASEKNYRWSVCRSHATLAGKSESVYVVTLLREKGRVIPFVSNVGVDDVLGKAVEFLKSLASN